MKALIFSLLLILTACRSPEKLYSLALKRGMTIKEDSTVIQLPYLDSIVINYKDSTVINYEIKYKDSIILKSVVNFPKSNTAIRQEEKTKRKEIKSTVDIKEAEEETKQVEIKQSGKTERKVVKSKSSWWKFWLGLIVGLAFSFLITTLASKLKK